MSGAFGTDGAASSTGLSIGTASRTGTASSIDTGLGIGIASRNGAASSTASELDNPVWAALTGPQSALGTVDGRAALFDADVSPFGAFRDPSPISADWATLRALAGTEVIALPGIGPASIPADWQIVEHIPCHQMISRPLPDTTPTPTRSTSSSPRSPTSPQPSPRSPHRPPVDIVRLTPDDVPSMLDLVTRTEPGPFRARTIETGRYLGIRDADSLVAMSGERLRTPSWTELSAVCTDAAYRGRGLARALVQTLLADNEAAGRRMFLHVRIGNPAASLYESLGFTTRRAFDFTIIRAL